MAMLSWLSPVFGRKPNVAPFDYLDLTEEQKKALEGNITNMPKIQELGNLFQQFYLDQMDTAFGGTGIFRKIMASGGTTTQQMLDQAGTMLKGEVPEDVKNAVLRSSAYQSLTGGYAGSSMSGANTARNLGLTSLDMINKGANLAGAAGNAAQRWAALSGAGNMQGMLITPQQQSALDLQQSMIKHNLKQQKENIAAQRDPVIGGLSDIVETLTAAYVGSLGGGMGGKTGNIKNEPANASNAIDVSGSGWDSILGGDTGGSSNIAQGTGNYNYDFTPSTGLPPSISQNDVSQASPVSPDIGFGGTVSGFGGSVGGPNAGTTASLNQLLALLQGSTFNQTQPSGNVTPNDPWRF